MAFSGDLEHLSIVDVIQLLHTTRKTGTLKVQGRKGQISVVFSDGYIIGASHYERGARIGTILVEANVISADTLGKALHIQDLAGENRKPLIATLLENDLANHEAAYRGLETLIELSIVEILTWKKGSFALDVNDIQVCDEFRYFPDKLHEDFTLPTEHILMDALRIFDEKMRDGLLQMEEDLPDEQPAQTRATTGDQSISADDLGLGDLGDIKRKIPGVFEAIKDYHTEPPASKSNDTAGIFKQAASRLQQVGSLPETATIMLETVASLFPRALTLVAWEEKLVAERGIGISAPRESGPGPVMGFNIPLAPGSIFRFVLDKGHLFYGKSDDQYLREHLHAAIKPPLHSTILLLPLKLGKRVVSIIYADFSNQPVTDIPIQQLAGCAEHAGMAIESALLHKQKKP